MQEIKCPKCGEVFTVDESGYASILNQVRDAEFYKQLQERTAQLAKEKEKELQLAAAKAQMEKTQAATGFMQQIEQLKAQIATTDKDKIIAVSTAVEAQKEALQQKEKTIAELQNQIKELEENIH